MDATPSPFPGMDPYLENPALWPGFHVAFMAALRDQLGPLVRPRYFVRVKVRVYPASGRDLAVTNAHEAHEPYLEIIEREDRSVVTVIELLSPTIKSPRTEGREDFLQRRQDAWAGAGHWMEINLLRGGERTWNPPAAIVGPCEVYLARAGGEHRKTYVWPIRLTDRMPVIGVPLAAGDPDVPLDLQDAFAHVYDRGGYDLDIDYRNDPVPPLSPDDAEWARTLIEATGWLRTSE